MCEQFLWVNKCESMFVPVNATLCMSITTCLRMSMGASLNMSLCVEVNGTFHMDEWMCRPWAWILAYSCMWDECLFLIMWKWSIFLWVLCQVCACEYTWIPLRVKMWELHKCEHIHLWEYKYDAVCIFYMGNCIWLGSYLNVCKWMCELVWECMCKDIFMTEYVTVHLCSLLMCEYFCESDMSMCLCFYVSHLCV